jgi:hypothetical protein
MDETALKRFSIKVMVSLGSGIRIIILYEYKAFAFPCRVQGKMNL